MDICLTQLFHISRPDIFAAQKDEKRSQTSIAGQDKSYNVLKLLNKCTNTQTLLTQSVKQQIPHMSVGVRDVMIDYEGPLICSAV